MANPYMVDTTYGDGLIAGRLTDAGLLDLLATYRRRVAGTYRPLPAGDISKLSGSRMWMSTKIDGELWFLVAKAGERFLANPRGRVLAGTLLLLEQANGIEDGTILAGELHARSENSHPRVGDLAAALADGASSRASSIGFTAFDLLEEGCVTAPATYEARLARLAALLPAQAHLSVVVTDNVASDSEVQTAFEDRVIAGGAEGLVIRLENGLIYKLKPEITLDAAIVGYTAKADRPDLARSLLLALMREDGQYVLLGSCGNLGADSDREQLATLLAPNRVSTPVRWASDGGGLYAFVKPELVAQIKVTDLQGEGSDGSPSTAPVLVFDGTTWSSTRSIPSARPLHPVLQRLRSDKPLEAASIRFSQIEPWLGATQSRQETSDLPASTLIRREVWTKETKGQSAVRKLVVWKTNKEKIDSSFPAWVVHWTDYSATRATPLDREVRLAPDEAAAMQVADLLVEQNIKKGWNKAP